MSWLPALKWFSCDTPTRLRDPTKRPLVLWLANGETSWETPVYKLVGSIRLRLRDVTCCFARLGFVRESLQKTVRRSDSAVSITSRLSLIGQSSRAVTESKVWPQRWVGWFTSCFKQRSFSDDLNLDTSLSRSFSKWKLKSPIYYQKGGGGSTNCVERDVALSKHGA